MKNNKLTLKALKAELELMKTNKPGALVDIGVPGLDYRTPHRFL